VALFVVGTDRVVVTGGRIGGKRSLDDESAAARPERIKPRWPA
jgi:hypothetical protein